MADCEQKIGPVGSKYRIWLRRSDTHKRITDTNIWVGNVHIPKDKPYCKISSGKTKNDECWAFVEFDGKSLNVGDYLKFEHFAIYSVYRFPDFAMSVSIVFSIGNWNFSGAYGNAGSLWDWFGFSISKSIRKKTIL